MALWTDGDNQTAKRRNRESVVSRLLTPVYDINQGGTVTATVRPVDGDDVVTSETTHYTVGASVTVSIVHAITLTNSDTSSNQVSVHLVESGGSRTVANRIFSDTLIPGETLQLEGPWFLDPSDSIRSISSGASANEVGLRAEVTEFSDGHPEGVTCIVDDGSALTVSHAAYYTCPASLVQHADVMGITLCNTDTASQAVEVAIVPSGQAASGRYLIFADTLLAGETVVLGGFHTPVVLEAGDFVSAKAATGAVVSIRVSPVEFVTT